MRDLPFSCTHTFILSLSIIFKFPKIKEMFIKKKKIPVELLQKYKIHHYLLISQWMSKGMIKHPPPPNFASVDSWISWSTLVSPSAKL